MRRTRGSGSWLPRAADSSLAECSAMPETVPATLLIDGYEQACKRFYSSMNGSDRDATFMPLFEALSWIVCIDERLQSVWKAAPTNPSRLWSDGFTHGDTVKGVRFARNRVHHQWADALWLSLGAQLPRKLPFMLGEWRWRPELPPGRNNEFEAEYKHYVAGNPARVTLSELSQCFAEARVALLPAP